MAYRNARDRPVASTDFAKFCPEVFRKRFLRACIYQLILSYCVGVVASLNLRHGWFSVLIALVSTRTLVYTAVSYGAAVAVLLVHVYLYRVTRTTYDSHFPGLQRLLRNPVSTGAVIGAYVALAHAMFFVHGWISGGHNARMWLYPEGQYGPPQLNPAWLASWLLALATGASYGVQMVINERLQLSFPSIEQSRIHTLKGRLPTCFSRAFGFSNSVVLWFWCVYFVFGWFFYRIACGFLAHVLTTTAYAVGNPLFSPSGVVFWIHSGTTMVVTWEIAHQVFEVIATEPTHINELSRDSNLCLVNGLKHGKDQLVQHLAYQELYRLVEFSPERRVDIYTDIDRSTGSMWKQISAQCIDILKAATAQLQAQQKAAADAANASKKPVSTTGKPATDAVSKSLSGASVKSTLQQNSGGAANGIVNPARDTPAANTPAASAQALFEPEAQGLEKYIVTLIWNTLAHSKLGENVLLWSLHARSMTAFANFQMQVWAVRSLMRLVECSLEEDRYGVVQGDIGTVLEVVFAYMGALEKCAGIAEAGSGIRPFNVQTAARQPQMLAQVVRNSIYAFTTRFYVHLESLKLPVEVARKLQAYADFKA
ncbi:Nuclear pore complex subunit [Coemansia interrupta]|uniref:Nuclear pore complex subunit n=1 Tax=Coemansia interrupta TaxID=1126814 RepID=A0A9W8H997_9FUNG|nr:Nuclear pore complex subunit [Coemansia interrupta]